MAPKGGGRRKTISEEQAAKLQKKLKAACVGTSAATLLKRYDKSKDGVLDTKELTELVRRTLKIGSSELSDADICELVAALDDDGGGSISIVELADFIERGSATGPPPKGAESEPASASVSASSARPSGKKRTRRHEIDDETAEKLQARLRAATIGTDPRKLFSKYDRDRAGTLDETEFTMLVRKDLKLAPNDVSEKDIKALVAALDDDGEGTLSIEELADFVERGKATFYAARESGADAAPMRWGAHEDTAEMKALRRRTKERQAKPGFDEAVIGKLRSRLRAATLGTAPAELFASFDRSGDGHLDARELTALIRKELKIPTDRLSDADVSTLVRWLDDDGTGSLSIAELADFVERGAATFNAGPDGGEQDERVAGLKWGERAEDSAELKAAKAETAAKAARAKEKPPAAVELPQVSRKDLPKAKAADRRRGKRALRIDPDTAHRVQVELLRAVKPLGDDAARRKFFESFDASGDGALDASEMRPLLRKQLRVAADMVSDDDIAALVNALDDDGSDSVPIAELLDFVDHGLGKPSEAARHRRVLPPRERASSQLFRAADDDDEQDAAGPAREPATEYERTRAAQRARPVVAYREALEAEERISGSGLGTAATLVSVARAQIAQADGDARALARVARTYERALAIFRAELGPTSPSVLRTLALKARVLEDAGERREASEARAQLAQLQKRAEVDAAFEAEARRREAEQKREALREGGSVLDAPDYG